MSPIRSRVVAAAAAFVVIMAGGGVAIAGSEPAADLELALLAAEDLPAELQPSGLTHDPTFDIDEASFTAHGGIDRVQQTWQSSSVDPQEPVVIVFDFRMLFPDDERAQAYLEAAEPILSESVTGLELQPVTPTLGEDSRHYAGSLSQDALTIDLQNLLFRVGPVVSKVFVGGFGTTPEDALPIAMAAGARVETWLLARLLASPAAGSPPPTLEPTVTPPSVSAQLRQWAVDAVASSEYGSDSWSAMQATGPPDVTVYADDPDAWASSAADGTVEWLEVGYAVAVVPTAVHVHESFGSGAVSLLEAWDTDAGAWVELWSGVDPMPDELAVFSPPLTVVPVATDRLRITIDSDRVAGWNEIDAVELVGEVPRAAADPCGDEPDHWVGSTIRNDEWLYLGRGGTGVRQVPEM